MQIPIAQSLCDVHWITLMPMIKLKFKLRLNLEGREVGKEEISVIWAML